MPTMTTDALEQLVLKSAAVRKHIVRMAHQTKTGHMGSALSMVDILVTLYFSHLRIFPEVPLHGGRDRFVLSKGHGCAALYAVLAERGFFPVSDLDEYLQDGGRFPGHPSSRLLPGIEYSSGSLGHGLGIATGMALAARIDAASRRTVVVLSDGECDEGSTWEAALSAAQWNLRSLTCIVDYNKLQGFGRMEDVLNLEPFAQKWSAFRWNTEEVDGHDHAQILAALRRADQSDRPTAILAHTIKGKGLPSLENTVASHYWPPSQQQIGEASLL